MWESISSWAPVRAALNILMNRDTEDKDTIIENKAKQGMGNMK